MRVIFAAWAVSISLMAAGAQAGTQDVQSALEAVGCVEASDGEVSPLAIKTAVRCFQKGINATPDGFLSAEEERQLLEMAAAGGTVVRQKRYEAQRTRREDLYGVADKKPTSTERRAAMMKPRHMNRKSAPGSFAHLEDLADRAEAGDPTLKRSRTVGTSMALVTSGGTPVLAYRKELDRRYGFYLNDTIDCIAPGVLRFVFSMAPLGQNRIPERFDPSGQMDVRISADELDIDTILPGGAQGLGMVERIDEKGEPASLFRASIEISTMRRLAKMLGATKNLRVQVMRGSQYLPLYGGADLSGFETDIRPLVAYCEKTHPDYKPPPPTVAEVAASQVLGFHPTDEQLQVALSRFYALPFGGLGLLLGETDVEIGYENFEVLQCLSAKRGDTFCQFSGKLVSDGGKLGPVITGIGSMATILGPRWVSLETKGSQWMVQKFYETCEPRQTSIYCTFWE